MSGEVISRERSKSETLVEEAERQRSQIHEILMRVSNIRECMIGAIAENPDKNAPSPSSGGFFGAIHAALYSTGRNIEGIYDELRPIEKALGIQAEKNPATPARLGKIGR